MVDKPLREFYISPKYDTNGILRISMAFASQFPNIFNIQGRALTHDGKEFPIILNIQYRTLDGLKVWLKSLPLDQNYMSFRIFIETTDPLRLNIAPSDVPVAPEKEDLVKNLMRPEEGFFLGRVLEDQFNELIATEEPFVIHETDLLTHTFICGVTGAGKTVIAKVLLEEAALRSIPVIAIDIKGDISSMALMYSGDNPIDLIPWTSPTQHRSVEQAAAHDAHKHRQNLEKWGISPNFIEDASKRISFNIFTPRSNAGFRLALSAFPEPPENINDMMESDPDTYDSLIDFLAQQFVSRLSVNKTLMEKGEGYVFEIIKACFSQDIPLYGYDGVIKVLEELRSPFLGIDLVGNLSTNEYISVKDREYLTNFNSGQIITMRHG